MAGLARPDGVGPETNITLIGGPNDYTPDVSKLLDGNLESTYVGSYFLDGRYTNHHYLDLIVDDTINLYAYYSNYDDSGGNTYSHYLDIYKVYNEKEELYITVNPPGVPLVWIKLGNLKKGYYRMRARDGYVGFNEFYVEDLALKYIIKHGNQYSNISDNKLVEIEGTITNEFINNNGNYLPDIIDNIDIIPDKFQLLSNKSYDITISGIKSKSELVVASDNISTKIQSHIDYFKLYSSTNENSSIKVVFSIDGGTTWKSYTSNQFVDLDIDIPLKSYNELTTDEKTKWNTAKDKILESGISSSELSNIDFNSLNIEKIRFAYVLSIKNIDDNCNTTKLEWQFDAKGSMKKMKDSEYEVTIGNESLKFKSLINNDMIKLNIEMDTSK